MYNLAIRSFCFRRTLTSDSSIRLPATCSKNARERQRTIPCKVALTAIFRRTEPMSCVILFVMEAVGRLIR